MACKELNKENKSSIEGKEYVDGACFGVDCLGSYHSIQNTVRLSTKACDQYLQIIKARIQADEIYGKSLAKISTMQLEIFPGTLHDCLEQFKADMNHKSTQHLILADTINNDIYVPILELRNHLETKEKEITAQYLKMQQEIKNLEDTYKKRIYTYEKCYKDALHSIETLKKYEKDKGTNGNDSQFTQSTIQSNNLIASLATTLSPSITSLANKTKSNEILQWVVSASSSTSLSSSSSSSSLSLSSNLSPIIQNVNDLQQNINDKISKAERQRLLARKSWIEYIITCQRYSLKTQILMTKLQGQLESVIVILQDHMRKMIVFESSSLANQQYDIQMLFKAMERIDVRGDILSLIDTYKNSLTEKEFPWISNIFSDIHLSHFSELPLPPSNKSLTTDLSPHPVWLDRNTINEFSKMILLQRYPETSEEEILVDNIQGLGVYDGLINSSNNSNNKDNKDNNKNIICEDGEKEEKEEEAEEEGGEWYECAEDVLSKLVVLQNHTRQYWLDIIENFNCNIVSHNYEGLSSPKSFEINEEKVDSDDDNLITTTPTTTPTNQNKIEINNNNNNNNNNHIDIDIDSNMTTNNSNTTLITQDEDIIDNFENQKFHHSNIEAQIDDLSLYLQNNNSNEMAIKTENIINSWGLLDAVFNNDETFISNHPSEMNSNETNFSYFPSEVLSHQNQNELLIVQDKNEFPTRHISLL